MEPCACFRILGSGGLSGFQEIKSLRLALIISGKPLMPIVRCLQCLFKHVYNAHCKLLIMGIVKTLYDLLAQMCKYSFGLIRMEPCYFWVPFKPSHLLPGVDPGVSFDFLHGEV